MIRTKKRILLFLLIFLLGIGIYFLTTQWDLLYNNIQLWYFSQKYNNGNVQYDSTVETRTLFSRELNNQNREFKIYLPKEYASDPKARFPVVYLLHGYPGSDKDWLINTNLQKRLDEKIKKKIIPPIIVVFPDMNGPVERDSQYINATLVNQNMENYFIRELIPFVDREYRTISKREKRAIGGLSSGAYGALFLGLHHNDLFSYIFSHSGYMQNTEGAMYRLIKDFPHNKTKYNLLSYVKTTPLDKKTFIYLDIGTKDYLHFQKDNIDFAEVLKKKGITFKYQTTDGGHGWKVWSSNINNSLSLLKKVF
jgi:enterochelin esterase-like enzyme